MDVVLIEDEAAAADGLVALLSRYDASIRVVERLDSVEDAVRWFAQHPPPRLVLLDVQLADGLCFDIFPQVSIHCPIIFTTAYDQYAIQAFQVTSIDYLLKPIAYADLHRALDKLRRLTTEFAPPPEVDLNQLTAVFQQLQKPYKTRFLARNNDRLQFKAAEEIAYFCADGKFVHLVGLDQRRFLVDYSLEQLETLLDPRQFFRLNRKYLVSLAAVQDIRTYAGSRLRVLLPPPGTEVIISRERVADFKAWLDH